MRGNGRIFRRGRIWWIAYSRNGREYRESSRGPDEASAKGLLGKRLARPTADSLTLRELSGRPDLIEELPLEEVKALYGECLAALRHLRTRLSGR
jgi:hypothetical protein